MPSAQVRNASMQQLSSADQLDVEDRNWGAEWFDSAGGTTFTAATVVPLAGERHNSAPEVYEMASNILTVREAGLYLILYTVTADQSLSSELNFQAYLELDPDAGSFAQFPGSTGYNTMFNGAASISNYILLRLGIDYRLRLVVARIGGADVPALLQYESKLTIVRLFKNG